MKVQKAYEWKRLRGGILCWSGARSASSAARWTVDTVVNLEEYPMKDLKSANARNVIDGLRQALLADGYCVMRRFLRTEAVDAAVAEVRARESLYVYQYVYVEMRGSGCAMWTRGAKLLARVKING